MRSTEAILPRRWGTIQEYYQIEFTYHLKSTVRQSCNPGDWISGGKVC